MHQVGKNKKISYNAKFVSVMFPLSLGKQLMSLCLLGFGRIIKNKALRQSKLPEGFSNFKNYLLHFWFKSRFFSFAFFGSASHFILGAVFAVLGGNSC
jgi:hypothetical protein